MDGCKEEVRYPSAGILTAGFLIADPFVRVELILKVNAFTLGTTIHFVAFRIKRHSENVRNNFMIRDV